MKTPKQILQDARNLIDHVGWCKYDFVRKRYDTFVESTPIAYCMIGAISTSGEDHFNEAIRVALEALQQATMREVERQSIMGVVSISGFNDYPTTTKEMVLKVLDDAINLLEEE